MNIAEWLGAARALGVERFDAQLLLAHRLARPRAWLLAHDDEVLDPVDVQWLQAALARRAAGVPLHQLTGRCHFAGLELAVTADVLIPRPETEALVDWASACSAGAPSPRVLDLGTGSGAIVLALLAQNPHLHAHASDASAAALAVARGNGERLGLAVDWREGSWWTPWKGERFGLVVSNPPYIAGGDPHLAALRHEPLMALTPDGNAPGDGLSALFELIDGAPAHLLPGAWLLLEHGHDQGPTLRARLSAVGFQLAETRQDLAGLDRLSGARWPG